MAGSWTPLRGRSAVITGASRGIGQECARALHTAGARLVLLGRDVGAMTDLGKNLGKPDGQPITTFAADLAEPDVVQRVLAKVRAHLGGVPDILVNNAGQFFVKPVEETSVEEFQRMLAVNLTSQFALIHEFLPGMRTRGSGHIVTIGSIADHRAFPENSAYSASKYGVRGLHEVLREELRNSGVRATLVSPAPVDTPIWDAVQPEKRKGHTPRAMMLDAAAVADAVLYAVTRPDTTNIDELRMSRA
jgi:short-subunit dehydrogenase